MEKVGHVTKEGWQEQAIPTYVAQLACLWDKVEKLELESRGIHEMFAFCLCWRLQ